MKMIFPGTKQIAMTLVLAGLLFFQIGCKKGLEDLLDTTSTITVNNPTFTTIDLTFNGQSRTIAPGGSVVFTDDEYTSAYGTATTAGSTNTGTQIGLRLSWTINDAFPVANNNRVLTLNTDPDMFFLKIQNVSSKPIQKVYSNYGLAYQTIDNILIPNDGNTYSLGYYKAFTNSNVRAESASSYWYWSPLGLTFTNNQSKILVAN
jgi:hypothetical protein